MAEDLDIEHHLLVISEKQHDEGSARESFNLLYLEFRQFVYNVAVSCLHSPIHRNEMGESILGNVFLHIYNKPIDWCFHPEVHKSEKGAFKAYLSTVTKKCALAEIRNSLTKWDREDLTIDSPESLFEVGFTEQELAVADGSLSNNHQVIEEVLSELKERDREIIRTYFTYYQEGKKMPREVMSELITVFKTTPDNIRQVVSRTKKKIKALAQSRILRVTR